MYVCLSIYIDVIFCFIIIFFEKRIQFIYIFVVMNEFPVHENKIEKNKRTLNELALQSPTNIKKLKSKSPKIVFGSSPKIKNSKTFNWKIDNKSKSVDNVSSVSSLKTYNNTTTFGNTVKEISLQTEKNQSVGPGFYDSFNDGIYDTILKRTKTGRFSLTPREVSSPIIKENISSKKQIIEPSISVLPTNLDTFDDKFNWKELRIKYQKKLIDYNITCNVV